MLPIVTLFGQSGSGKSTVGRYLAETYGGKSLAFADPMKEICKLQFDFNDKQLYGESEERNTPVKIKDWRREEKAEANFVALFNNPNYWTYGNWLNHLRNSLFGTQEGKLSPRDALKSLGEMAKTIEPDVWVKNTLQKARSLLIEGSKFVVITDGRFLVEAISVKELGGTNVLIKRTDYASTTDPTHVSETAINNIPSSYFDYKLLNTTSNDLNILFGASKRLAEKLRLDSHIPMV